MFSPCSDRQRCQYGDYTIADATSITHVTVRSDEVAEEHAILPRRPGRIVAAHDRRQQGRTDSAGALLSPRVVEPYQTHGSVTEPLNADCNGHFIVSNVFAGGIHISALSPQFQEERGEFEGSIGGEPNKLSGVRIVAGRRRRRHDYGDRVRRPRSISGQSGGLGVSRLRALRHGQPDDHPPPRPRESRTVLPFGGFADREGVIVLS